MVTKTITTKVDDIDGSEAEGSYTFTWQGYKYHIDLSAAHAEELRSDIEKWIKFSRRDRGNGRVARTPRANAAADGSNGTAPTKRGPEPGTSYRAGKSNGPSTADIRAWAASKGIEVASRGRLAPAIIQQYLAENPAQ